MTDSLFANRSKALALFVALTLTLHGCGWFDDLMGDDGETITIGDEKYDVNIKEYDGTIVMPPGLGLPATELTAFSFHGGQVPIEFNGSFVVKGNDATTGFVSVVDKSDRVLTMAIFPKDEKLARQYVSVSPRSTARAMVFLQAGIAVSDPLLATLVLEAIDGCESMDYLESLVEQRLFRLAAAQEDPFVEQTTEAEGLEFAEAIADITMELVQRAAQSRERRSRFETDVRGLWMAALNLAFSPQGDVSNKHFFDADSKNGDLIDVTQADIDSTAKTGKFHFRNYGQRWMALYLDDITAIGLPSFYSSDSEVELIPPRNFQIPGLVDLAMDVAWDVGTSIWNIFWEDQDPMEAIMATVEDRINAYFGASEIDLELNLASSDEAILSDYGPGKGVGIDMHGRDTLPLVLSCLTEGVLPIIGVVMDFDLANLKLSAKGRKNLKSVAKVIIGSQGDAFAGLFIKLAAKLKSGDDTGAALLEAGRETLSITLSLLTDDVFLISLKNALGIKLQDAAKHALKQVFKVTNIIGVIDKVTATVSAALTVYWFVGDLFLEDAMDIYHISLDPVEEEETELDKVAVFGAIPGVFTLEGGEFTLSVSPVDSNGDMLTGTFTKSNFNFSEISASALFDSEVVVDGVADVVEVVQKQANRREEGITVAILLDSSGSMEENDSQELRKDAAKGLVDLLGPDDRATVLDFDSVYTEFTGDHDILHEAIDSVGHDGSTPLYSTILDGLTLLVEDGGGRPTLVALTDGKADDESLIDEVIGVATENVIPVFAVGLGQNLDFSELQQVADATGGTFAEASMAEDLVVVFDAVGTGVTAGWIKVHGEGVFLQPIEEPGDYRITGSLITNVGAKTFVTPFKFTTHIYVSNEID